MNNDALLTTLYPKSPIEGANLTELTTLLMTQWSDIEVRDLDLSMALNIPPNRISHFKRAKSSIEGSGASEGERENESNNQIPMVHPHQAILIRLLMRYPQYAPLVKRPTNQEVWDLISGFLPKPLDDKPRRGPAPKGDVEKKGFAPLFGRAAVSSYKMLPSKESASKGDTSLPVVRLQMIVLNRFADLFREIYRRYSANYMFAADRKNPLYEPQARGWEILRERDSLTEWMSEDVLTQFVNELQGQWQRWFEDAYLPVLRREAISRHIDPDIAIRNGNWTNTEPVTDEEYRSLSRDCKPITGSSQDYTSWFRGQMQTTSAEMFWVLGMQVKGFYRHRERENQRLDASTSLLVRYLQSYPNDLNFFVETPPSGAWLLKKIQGIDPAFKRFHLGPLFGASKMASYKFAASETECPYFARRLAAIFARELPRGPEIYWQLRQCVEDEAKARRLNLETFWQQGKWHD